MSAGSVFWTEWGDFALPTPDPTLNKVMKVSTAGGAPTELATNLLGPRGIAVDASFAYFVSAGSVFKVPIDGGTVVELAANLDFPGNLAVDAMSVYVALDGTSGRPMGWGSLARISVDAGAPDTLATASRVLSGSYVAVGDHEVYWTQNAYTATGCLGGALMRVPLADTPPTMLASGCLGPVVVDAAAVYFLDLGSARAADGSVIKLSSTSTTPIALAVDQFAPTALAVGADRIFWTTAPTSATAADGTLMAIAK